MLLSFITQFLEGGSSHVKLLLAQLRLELLMALRI